MRPGRTSSSALVAYITYLRPYRSVPFISLLVHMGLTTAERPYDDQTERIAAKLKPNLIVIVLRPGSEVATEVVRRFAQNSTALVVALAPGPQTTGFSELLANGADLCLRETDAPEFIEAQLRAVLRRVHPDDEKVGVIQLGDLRIDSGRCVVAWRDTQIPMSPTEFRILRYLAERPGHVVSAHELMRSIHDYAPSVREARDASKVYVRRLRQKFESVADSSLSIVTARGFGYFLDVPAGSGGDVSPQPARPTDEESHLGPVGQPGGAAVYR